MKFGRPTKLDWIDDIIAVLDPSGENRVPGVEWNERSIIIRGLTRLTHGELALLASVITSGTFKRKG